MCGFALTLALEVRDASRRESEGVRKGLIHQAPTRVPRVGDQGVDCTRSGVSWLTMLDESSVKTGANRNLVEQLASSVYFTTRF